MARFPKIDKELFIHNRKLLIENLLPKSIAIVHSNDIYPTNADGTMPFKQNSNLLWLCGIDQEETTLILFPDAPRDEWKEILFIRETNEEIAIWEGAKLTKEQAREISGIQTIYRSHEFDKILKLIIFEAENIYLETNEHVRSSNEVPTLSDRNIVRYKSMFPLHQYQRLAPILGALRSIKHPVEVELLKNACQLTRDAFLRVLRFIKPGVKEYEIEAEYLHEFIRKGASGFAYSPIIASGADSCVLHYIANDKECKDGDILLMDVGVCYAHYNSDMTRCVPVNGKFTQRQREVYDAVLRVMRQAIDMLRPGNNLNDYHKAVGHLMEEELIKLGLLDAEAVKKQDPEKPLYKKYFMHGTSHFLGLDVHDVGPRFPVFQPGMVFTCEPGIYIREEGLGIRLENDILITPSGPVDLMADIPVEAEEIEHLMNES